MWAIACLALIIGGALGTVPPSCEPCIAVEPAQEGDPLAGTYTFHALDSECPGGCSYSREGQIYCFGPGPNSGTFQCGSSGSPGESTEGTAAGTTSPGNSDSSSSPASETSAGVQSTSGGTGSSTTGSEGSTAPPSTAALLTSAILSTEASTPGPATSSLPASTQPPTSSASTAPPTSVLSTAAATSTEQSVISSSNVASTPPITSSLATAAHASSTEQTVQSSISLVSTSTSLHTTTVSSFISSTTAAPSSALASTSAAGTSSDSATTSVADTSSAISSTLASTSAQTSTIPASTKAATTNAATTTAPATTLAPSTTAIDSTVAATTAPVTTVAASTTAKCPTFTGSETCPGGWTQHGLKCYQLQSPSPLSGLIWSKAKEACEGLFPGGYLASIESQCDQDFVFAMLGTEKETYLGANDIDAEGTWTWIKSGGETFLTGGATPAGKYGNWQDGEPNNGGTGQDCLVIGTDGLWKDQICSKASRFLCETAASEGGVALTAAPTTLGPTAACATTCDDGWETMSDCLCYKAQKELKTWSAAKDGCNTLKEGASLVSLTSATVEAKAMDLLGGWDAVFLKDGYWTGGNDLANGDTEFRWEFDQEIFWRRDTAKEIYCCEVSGKYNNWIHVSATAIMPNHKNAEQNCVKMKFVIDETTSAMTKQGWDDVDCNKKPIPSVCQYSTAFPATTAASGLF